MRHIASTLILPLLIAAAPANSAAAAEDTADVQMKLISSGAMQKLGGYMPQRLGLSADKPAELKKAPDLAAPLYGSIKFGGASYLVIVDEPEGKDAKLIIDTNGNGDLTDDTAATWKTRTYRGQGGKEFTQYSGSFELPLGTGEKAQKVSLGTYRFDKNDPQRAPLKNFLLYYRDYAWDGQITLNGAKYHTMISDDRATGDLRASVPDAAGEAAGPAAQAAPIPMLIDVN